MLTSMIILATDFGIGSPYMAQMQAVIAAGLPLRPIIPLFADLPSFDPISAGYVLAAHMSGCAAFKVQPNAPAPVLIAVVDPGVGSERHGLLLNLDGMWCVGPDNGLFTPLCRQARSVAAWRLPKAPNTAAPTFHGRDVFAPTAVTVAQTGHPPDGAVALAQDLILPSEDREDRAKLVYFDHYGNAMSALRRSDIQRSDRLGLRNRPSGSVFPADGVGWARTFSSVPNGMGFWYENSNGLIEIAVNGGSAQAVFHLGLGDNLLIMQQKVLGSGINAR